MTLIAHPFAGAGAARFAGPVAGPTPPPPVQSHLQMDGQSLANTPASPTAFGILYASLDPVWWPSSHNAAVNGSYYTERQNGGSLSAATRVDPHLSVYQNVIVDVAGQSDLGPFGAPASAATVFARAAGYAAERRAAGWDLYCICTVPPSTFFTGDTEVQRLAYNTLLRQDDGANFDVVADIASIPELANPSNGTYWSDGLHWTEAGATLGMAVVKAALAEIAAV